MLRSIQDKDGNNVYARNVQAEIIHISAAQSGRRGYFCLGCNRDMQAVISTIANRMSYFRHDAKDVTYKTQCTYSDETYRHKLAKEILQRLKRIKLPPVYKYPPKGINGKANLLTEATFIEASSVRIEQCFYEDEEGIIQSGRPGKMDDKYLLIQPDVTFYNLNNEPILFIEIVATHAVKPEKLIKIKRLGIDTIQITIPKSSPQDIEDTFFTSERTKWIYNGKQEGTQYIHLPDSDSEGIPPIDEDQRKLFEETFECRSAQIKNLIRSIEKCLGTKPYHDAERSIRREVSRVERNTEEHREQLSRLQRGIRIELEQKYSSQTIELESKAKIIEDSYAGVKQKYSELEERYNRKRRTIAESHSEYTKRIEQFKEASRREIKGIENDINLLKSESFTYEEQERELSGKMEELAREERVLGFQEKGIEDERRNFDKRLSEFKRSNGQTIAEPLSERGRALKAAIQRIEGATRVLQEFERTFIKSQNNNSGSDSN